MNHTRVLRRALQTDERIRLGMAQHPVPSITAARVEHVVAPPSELQQALEQRSHRIGQLEAQLNQMQQDREQLRAQLLSFQEQLVASKEAAKQQGHAEGLKSAQAEMQRELTERASEWYRVVDQTSRQYDAAVQAIRAQLTEVATAAIGKLLGEHLLNPSSIRAAIEQTLKEAGIGAPAKVLIAPAQYEQLVRFGAAHLAALRERRIDIAPDPRVTAGGCLIEVPSGLIDARFETQLARLKDIIAGHLTAAGAAK